jgi:hypothetical protein
MSGERDTFLARWSRRKLEAAREPEDAPLQVDDGAVAAEAEGPAADPGLSPEEIDALPRIEDLTADSDITQFLRRGVPEVLKKAALRRMWSLDPAIRDYVGHARDYSYDWNVPDGVPGNGPLLPTDDVEELVDRVFGDRSRPAGEAGPLEPEGHESTSRLGDIAQDPVRLSAQRPAPVMDAVQHETPVQRDDANEEVDAGPPGREFEESDRGSAAVQSAAAPAGPETPRPRRHGGAKPL